MKRIASFGGTLAVGLLLIGAGCSGNTPAAEETANTPVADHTATNTDSLERTSADLTLQATAVGARQVKFEWTLGEGMDQPKSFILLRGEEAKPTHDGKTFWFRQPGSRRSATWVNLPAGDQHFRICTSDDGETCVTYSNDIKIEVLSGPARPAVAAPVKEENITPEESIDTSDDTTMIEEEISTEEDTTMRTSTEDEATMQDTTDDTATSTEEQTMTEEETTTSTEAEMTDISEETSTSTDMTDTTEDTTTSTEL